ncbi:hypothetical protein D3C72_1638610 [compost metagenome]
MGEDLARARREEDQQAYQDQQFHHAQGFFQLCPEGRRAELVDIEFAQQEAEQQRAQARMHEEAQGLAVCLLPGAHAVHGASEGQEQRLQPFQQMVFVVDIRKHRPQGDGGEHA